MIYALEYAKEAVLDTVAARYTPISDGKAEICFRVVTPWMRVTADVKRIAYAVALAAAGAGLEALRRR